MSFAHFKGNCLSVQKLFLSHDLDFVSIIESPASLFFLFQFGSCFISGNAENMFQYVLDGIT